MISEIVITGPMAWGLLAVVPLCLICAMLFWSRFRARRGERMETFGGEVSDGDLSLASQRGSSAETLGISLPLDEFDSRTALRGTEDGGSGDGDSGDAGSAVVDRETRETSDGVGKRQLVDFVSTDKKVRSLKLQESDIGQARSEIDRLEKGGQREEPLARLYFQVGEYLCFHGARSEGLEFIRKSIELATSGKNSVLLAQARMTLGELAVHDQDFVGACEQWQLARELFSNAGLKDNGEEISAHMYKCGCPTEWVLTEF